ncbi:hypothetical protein NQ318_002337 [Aromia moschata]|uniref:Uncharacterized protein n=1 Tax=Aromia moschata TaxID=1265417 RepID=A0AAV8Z3D5_9CUCU|nr:hypothetical protein NQ318_002337 [Aromia moschata]
MIQKTPLRMRQQFGNPEVTRVSEMWKSHGTEKFGNVDVECISDSTGTLVNSSQSILDKVKENHIDVIKPIEPNPQEEPNPVMCNSRKRSKRNRRGRWSKTPNKNSKQNILRQQINDMDIDLDIEPSSTVTDISMSPKEPHCFALTDFIIEKPCKMKPIQIKVDQSQHDSDEEHLPSEIAISPFGKMYVRERQVSITESEDSFIVFDSGTDEELAFSEESGTRVKAKMRKKISIHHHLSFRIREFSTKVLTM